MKGRISKRGTVWVSSCIFGSLLLLSGVSVAQIWTVSDKLLMSQGSPRQGLGASLAISGDTLAVGAPGSEAVFDVLGAVYLFERDVDGAWREVQRLRASDEVPGHRFGADVAIDDDLLVVGAYLDPMVGEDFGAAYVFERTEGGAWIETQKLVLPDAEQSDFFGWSVATAGGTVAVGAKRDSDIGFASGSVTLYERDGSGAWVEVQKLVASDGNPFDCFGSAMAMSEDTLMIGSTGYSRIGIGAGAVYAFERDVDGTWVEVQRIDPSDPIFAEELGWSIAFSAEVAVLGAPFGNDGGAVYVQGRGPDGSWVETQELISNSTERFFGLKSSLSDDTLAIGAEGHFSDGNSGAAFVLSRGDDGTWRRPVVLEDPDQKENDFFGVDVQLFDENELLVGDSGDTEAGPAAGAVYVYERVRCRVDPALEAGGFTLPGIGCAAKKLDPPSRGH